MNVPHTLPSVSSFHTMGCMISLYAKPVQLRSDLNSGPAVLHVVMKLDSSGHILDDKVFRAGDAVERLFLSIKGISPCHIILASSVEIVFARPPCELLTLNV